MTGWLAALAAVISALVAVVRFISDHSKKQIRLIGATTRRTKPVWDEEPASPCRIVCQKDNLIQGLQYSITDSFPDSFHRSIPSSPGDLHNCLFFQILI